MKQQFEELDDMEQPMRFPVLWIVKYDRNIAYNMLPSREVARNVNNNDNLEYNVASNG